MSIASMRAWSGGLGHKARDLDLEGVRVAARRQVEMRPNIRWAKGVNGKVITKDLIWSNFGPKNTRVRRAVVLYRRGDPLTSRFLLFRTKNDY